MIWKYIKYNILFICSTWPSALLVKNAFTGVSLGERLYITQLSSNLQSNYFSELLHVAACLCIFYISSQKEDSCWQAIACSRSTISRQKLDKFTNVYKVTIKTLEREQLMPGVFVINFKHIFLQVRSQL